MRGEQTAGLEGPAGNQDPDVGGHLGIIDQDDHHTEEELMSLLTRKSKEEMNYHKDTAYDMMSGQRKVIRSKKSIVRGRRVQALICMRVMLEIQREVSKQQEQFPKETRHHQQCVRIRFPTNFR